MFLQEPLHWHGKLPQEALNDRSTLCKLVLHLYFQDISGQGDKAEELQKTQETVDSLEVGSAGSDPTIPGAHISSYLYPAI